MGDTANAYALVYQKSLRVEHSEVFRFSIVSILSLVLHKHTNSSAIGATYAVWITGSIAEENIVNIKKFKI
jgi:hypothetical protein